MNLTQALNIIDHRLAIVNMKIDNMKKDMLAINQKDDLSSTDLDITLCYILALKYSTRCYIATFVGNIINISLAIITIVCTFVFQYPTPIFIFIGFIVMMVIAFSFKTKYISTQCTMAEQALLKFNKLINN